MRRINMPNACGSRTMWKDSDAHWSVLHLVIWHWSKFSGSPVAGSRAGGRWLFTNQTRTHRKLFDYQWVSVRTRHASDGAADTHKHATYKLSPSSSAVKVTHIVICYWVSSQRWHHPTQTTCADQWSLMDEPNQGRFTQRAAKGCPDVSLLQLAGHVVSSEDHNTPPVHS